MPTRPGRRWPRTTRPRTATWGFNRPAPAGPRWSGWRPATAGPGSLGVVLGIDRARLVDLARRRGCVLELVARVGEYVPTGARCSPCGPIPPSDDELLACVHVWVGRGPCTRTRHSACGSWSTWPFRPSRPPSTSRPPPCRSSAGSKTSCCGSRGGRNRRTIRRRHRAPVQPDPAGAGQSGLLDLAFTEITADGADSPQVARRLLA